MIAYHFPPLAGSSGVQRTLRFVQQLPHLGWEPLVLTTHPRAYHENSDDLLADIPTGTTVRRAFAFDTAKHLSLFGRYPLFLALPDRWVSWLLGAIPTGLAMIRNLKPSVIWSTYPIATAHLIGYALARLTGLPWIADFRDPMAHAGYPPDRRTWHSFLRVEQRVFSRANRIVFASPGAAEFYRQRYPSAADRISIIENGYDEGAFAAAEQGSEIGHPLTPGRLTLLHSGIVYPEERDPAALFAALAKVPNQERLKVRFRAPVHEELLRRLAVDHHLEDIVEVLPPLPYRDALAEMLRADGLLVLQAANCNEQIPAKVYEYLRAQRPILACTDPAGDTARTLAGAGITAIAPLDDPDSILALLESFVASPEQGTLAGPKAVADASRLARTRQLAALIDELVTG